MSTFGYAALARTASSLIAKFGQALTFTRVTSGDYDPTTGSATPTETTYTLDGVALDYEQSEIDGTLVRAGDRQVLLSADGAPVPQTGDRVTVNGAELSVVGVSTLRPSATTLLYTLQVRGVA